jgi:RNA polymerase sigma factor (sigma-70 family)
MASIDDLMRVAGGGASNDSKTLRSLVDRGLASRSAGTFTPTAAGEKEIRRAETEQRRAASETRRSLAAAEREQRTLERDRERANKEEAGKLKGDAVAFFTRPDGTVVPITAPSGAPMRKWGKTNTMFDPVTGKAYVRDDNGKLIEQDPATTGETVEKDGHIYKVVPGMAWKWAGYAPDAKLKPDAELKENLAERTRVLKQEAAAATGALSLIGKDIASDRARIKDIDRKLEDIRVDGAQREALEQEKAQLEGVVAAKVEKQAMAELDAYRAKAEVSYQAAWKEQLLKDSAADKAKLIYKETETLPNTGRMPERTAAVQGYISDLALTLAGVEPSNSPIRPAAPDLMETLWNEFQAKDAAVGAAIEEGFKAAVDSMGSAKNVNQWTAAKMSGRTSEAVAKLSAEAPIALPEKVRKATGYTHAPPEWFTPEAMERQLNAKLAGQTDIQAPPGYKLEGGVLYATKETSSKFWGVPLPWSKKTVDEPIGKFKFDRYGVGYVELDPLAQQSPSFAAGNYYRGMPEYVGMPADFAESFKKSAYGSTPLVPEVRKELDAKGWAKEAEAAWEGRRWDAERLRDVMDQWQAATDGERAAIIAQIDPRQAGVSASERRLDAAWLHKTGQLSAQDARMLLKTAYGTEPGMGSVEDAFNAWAKTGTSDAAERYRKAQAENPAMSPWKAALVRAAGEAFASMGGRMVAEAVLTEPERIAAVNDYAAREAFMAEYAQEARRKVDFNLPAFIAARDRLLGDESFAGQAKNWLNGTLQNAYGSSVGVMVGAGKLMGDDIAQKYGFSPLLSDAERELIGAQTIAWQNNFNRALKDRMPDSVGEALLMALPSSYLWNLGGVRDKMWSGEAGSALKKEIEALKRGLHSGVMTEPELRAAAGRIKTALDNYHSLVGGGRFTWENDLLNPRSKMGQALAAYQQTLSPSYWAAFEAAALNSQFDLEIQHKAMEYASQNNTIAESSFFGPLQQAFYGGQVAPMQEMGIEIASQLVGVGAGKLLTLGKWMGSAERLGLTLNRAGREISRLDGLAEKFFKLGKVERPIGGTLTVGQQARNLGVDFSKQLWASAGGEAMEEGVAAFGQSGATFGDAVAQAFAGFIGGVGMTGPHAAVGWAAAQYDIGKMRKAQEKALKQWVEDHNTRYPEEPITYEQAKTMQEYQNPQMVADLKGRLAAVVEKDAELARKLKTLPPVVWQAAGNGPAQQVVNPEISAAAGQRQALMVEYASILADMAGIGEGARRAVNELGGVADGDREAIDAAIRMVSLTPLTPTQEQALLNVGAYVRGNRIIVPDSFRAKVAKVAPETAKVYFGKTEADQLAEAAADGMVAAPPVVPQQAPQQQQAQAPVAPAKGKKPAAEKKQPVPVVQQAAPQTQQAVTPPVVAPPVTTQAGQQGGEEGPAAAPVKGGAAAGGPGTWRARIIFTPKGSKRPVTVTQSGQASSREAAERLFGARVKSLQRGADGEVVIEEIQAPESAQPVEAVNTTPEPVQETAESGQVAPVEAPATTNQQETGSKLLEAPAEPMAPAEGFDSEKWNQERDDRIKASKAAGNEHLDDQKRFVENSRGRTIYNVHDPKERGVIRTVDNRGNVYIKWKDKYSAEKNLATNGQTFLMPTDLKDYVFAPATQEAKPAPKAKKPKAAPKAKKAAAKSQKVTVGIGDMVLVPGVGSIRPQQMGQVVGFTNGDSMAVVNLRNGETVNLLASGLKKVGLPAYTEGVPSVFTEPVNGNTAVRMFGAAVPEAFSGKLPLKVVATDRLHVNKQWTQVVTAEQLAKMGAAQRGSFAPMPNGGMVYFRGTVYVDRATLAQNLAGLQPGQREAKIRATWREEVLHGATANVRSAEELAADWKALPEEAQRQVVMAYHAAELTKNGGDWKAAAATMPDAVLGMEFWRMYLSAKLDGATNEQVGMAQTVDAVTASNPGLAARIAEVLRDVARWLRDELLGTLDSEKRAEFEGVAAAIEAEVARLEAAGRPAEPAKAEAAEAPAAGDYVRSLEIERAFNLSSDEAAVLNLAIDAVEAAPGKWTTLAEGIQKEALRLASPQKSIRLSRVSDLGIAKKIAEKYLPAAVDQKPADADAELEALFADFEKFLPPAGAAPVPMAQRGQLKNAVRAIHGEALKQRDGFLADLVDAARQAGARPYREQFRNAVKKLGTAVSKIDRSPKIPSDLLRATVEAPAGGPGPARQVAARFIRAMEAKGYTVYSPGGVAGIYDRHADPASAYKDINLKFVKDGEGLDPIVKEVLVIQPAMLKAKSAIHKWYDIWRDAVNKLKTESDDARSTALLKTARRADYKVTQLAEAAANLDSTASMKARALGAQAESSVQSSPPISLTSFGKSGGSGKLESATERAFAFVSSLPIQEDTTAEGSDRQPIISENNIFDYAGDVDASRLAQYPDAIKEAFAYDKWDLVDGRVRVVPLSSLISRKNELQDARFLAGLKPDPRQTAIKGMLKNIEGDPTGKKRAPLDVSDNGDGTFTIIDGNATAQAAMLAGWTKIPVRVVEGVAAASAPTPIAAVADTPEAISAMSRLANGLWSRGVNTPEALARTLVERFPGRISPKTLSQVWANGSNSDPDQQVKWSEVYAGATAPAEKPEAPTNEGTDTIAPKEAVDDDLAASSIKEDTDNERDTSKPAAGRRGRKASSRRANPGRADGTSSGAGLGDLLSGLVGQRKAERNSGVARRRKRKLSPVDGREGTRADSGNDVAQPGGSGSSQGTAPDVGDAGNGGRGNRGGNTSDTGGTQERPATSGEPSVRERPPVGSPDRNHVIERGAELAPRGAISKIKANIRAIEIVKAMAAEGRQATAEEKAELVQFSGWGAVPQVFDDEKADEIAGGAITRYRETAKDYRERGSSWGGSSYWNDLAEKEEQEAEKLESWQKQWGKYHNSLKSLLTDAEYRGAKRSTINAHYTSTPIVAAMWDIAERLGFKGGNVLEPGAGIGHFFGLMPESLADRSRLFGVELEPLTAQILKALYPEADIQNAGFQNADIADNSIDLAISNVPFANVKVADRAMEAMGGPVENLHDYFFGKTLTKLKPGGVMVFITSAFTMDKGNSEIRRWLADRADMVAAYRLPNDAFKANAGTDVVTDIIVLRKKDGRPFEGAQDFITLGDSTTHKGDPIRVNGYFARNPGNVLGLLADDGEMFAGREDGKKEMTVHGDPNRPPEITLAQALPLLPENVFGSDASTSDARTYAGVVKMGNIVETDGKFYFHGQEAPDADLNNPKNAPRVRAFLEVRDALNGQYDLELSESATDEEIEENRKALNETYDAFVKKHGQMHDRKNKALFVDDPDYFRLAGAEVEKGRDKGIAAAVKDIAKSLRGKTEYTKADIFRKRVLAPRNEPTTADSLEDAFGISLGWRGRVDTSFIASLTGSTPEQVERALVERQIAVRDPDTGQILTREQYLSGNVREKLEVAQNSGPDYERNVRLLEAVQPERVGTEDILFSIGATWVPAEIYERFLRSLGYVGAKLTYMTGKDGATADRWTVDMKDSHRSGDGAAAFETRWLSVPEMMDSLLNFRRIEISNRDENGKKTVDDAATAASREAATKLNAHFIQWARTSESVSQELADIYNKEVNAHAQRNYDGQFLQFPWANKDFDIYPDKKNTIWRAIQEGFGLIAHGVGGGKTIIGSAIALEMRRLGMAKKPMIVVHNATLEGFAKEIARMAPTARVLVGRKDELTGDKRREFLMRIAAGDWDAVVIAHSTFGLIEDDPEVEIAHMTSLIDEMLDSLRAQGFDSLEEAKAMRRKPPTVKNLVKQIERLETAITKASERQTDTGLLNFQQLGVDALIVDEVHQFKKMPFSTKLEAKGIDGSFSKRGYSLFMRARYIQERMGGKNVFTMTGTPVTNTLGEIWNMVRLVAPRLLQEYGVTHFDQFVSKFARVATASEMTPGGDYKEVQRLSEVINIPEWATFLRLAADVKLGEDLVVKDRPGIKGGKPQLVTVNRTSAVAQWVQYIRRVLDAYGDLGADDFANNPSLTAVPMQAFMASRAAAVDIRLVEPRAKDEPNSKVNVMLDRAMELYQQTKDYKGTQVIFGDIFNNAKIDLFRAVAGTFRLPLDPEKSEGTTFNLYDDIRAKLIARGVPAEQIAVITDKKWDNDKKKQQLFDMVNDGTIRFVIGSTQKLGTGVNMQRRMIAAHHLDVPWTPAELEQRDGRVFRQGNIHGEMGVDVELWRYGMKDTLDAALWQKLETKQRFTTMALSGKVTGRSLEEADEVMTLAEQRAVLSGPFGQRMFEIGMRLKELDASREGHEREASSRRWGKEYAAKTLSREVKRAERNEPAMVEMEALGRAITADGIQITVGGQAFETRTAAAEAITEALRVPMADLNPVGGTSQQLPPVTNIAVNGVPIRLHVELSEKTTDQGEGFEERYITQLVPSYRLQTALDQDPNLNFGRVTSAATLYSRLEELSETVVSRRAEAANIIANQQKILDRADMDTWPYQEEYDRLKAELADLTEKEASRLAAEAEAGRAAAEDEDESVPPAASAPPVAMRDYMERQAGWLLEQARLRGYADFDEFFAQDNEAATRLMDLWSETHRRPIGGNVSGAEAGQDEAERRRRVEALTSDNLGLATYFAEKYSNIPNVEFDDRLQAARLGLVLAAETFDEARGVPFGAYASRIIKNELNGMFRSAVGAARRRGGELDAPMGQDGGTTGKDNVRAPESARVSAEDLATVREIVGTLPARPRRVWEALSAGRSMRDIGAEEGITGAMVHKIAKATRNTLRAELRRRGIESVDDVFPAVREEFPDRSAERRADMQDEEADKAAEGVAVAAASAPRVEQVQASIDHDAEMVAAYRAQTASSRTFAGAISDAENLARMATDPKEFYATMLRGRLDKLEFYAPGAKEAILDNRRNEALVAATINGMMEQMRDDITRAFGYPKFWQKNKKRLQGFLDEILPVAARLEVERIDDEGQFVFRTFNMRAGTMSEYKARAMQLREGDTVPTTEGVFILGPKIEGGRHLLLQTITADVQQKIYEDFHASYPEAAHYLDRWIMPGMEEARYMGPNGTMTAEFNRHALRDLFNQWPQELRDLFGAMPLEDMPYVEGYTPDVAEAKTLVAVISSLLNRFRSGARKIKAGEARRSGNIKNLFDGFSIRAMEAHREKIRVLTRQRLIEAAAVPLDSIPLEERGMFVPVDQTFNKLLDAIKLAKRLHPDAFPAITGALSPKDGAAMAKLLGDAFRLRGRGLMIHKEVERELMLGAVRQVSNNIITKILAGLLERLNAGLLATPFTTITNWASNELIKAVRTGNRLLYAVLSLAAGDVRAARLSGWEFAYLLRGFITDRMPSRQGQRIAAIVPRELFEDQTGLEAMEIDPTISVKQQLARLNVGGAFLQGVNYGGIDIGQKQQMAYAAYRAHAQVAWADAKRRGEIPAGTDKKAWTRNWMQTAPADLHRDVYLTTVLYLMDYQNVPAWLDPQQSMTATGQIFKRALLPFAKWPYNMARQLKRLTFDAALNTIMAGRTKQQRIEGMANLATMAGLVALGAAIAGADDDDDPILGASLDEEGRLLDAAFRTANRINISRLARIIFAHGAMRDVDFTLDDGSGESKDLWWRYRNYPYLKEAIMLGLFMVGKTGKGFEQLTDLSGEYVSMGILSKLSPWAMSSFDEGKSYPYRLGEGAYDLATAGIVPPPWRQLATRMVDPVTRRTRKVESLGYEAGPLDAIRVNTPGLSKTVPSTGTRKQSAFAPFSAEQWFKTESNFIKKTGFSPEDKSAAIDALRKQAVKLSMTPQEQVEFFRAAGLPVEKMNMRETSMTPSAQNIRTLASLGVGRESFGVTERTNRKTGTKTTMLSIPDPASVGYQPRGLQALRFFGGVNLMAVPRQTIYRDEDLAE